MKRGRVDAPFVIALLILVGFGLLMVFSASMYSSTVDGSKGYALFIKQFGFVFLGIVVMWILSNMDYRKYNSERFTKLLLYVTIVFLLLVFVPIIGVDVNGAKRWINLGVTQFQPSELAKITGILYLSSLIAREPEVLNKPGLPGLKEFALRCMVPIFVICGMTVIEPSMSAALAIGFGMIGVLYFGGVNFKRFGPYAMVLGIAVVVFLAVTPWRLERFNVFLGRGSADYQITQSLLAIGSGGFFGKGLGNGQQKFLFLPELQNDFIFANIGEEFGLVGCILVIALFAFIIYRGFKIAKASPDRFGYLYTSSVMLLLGFQVFVNIGVATQTIPVTGMALPFVSAGGTSMIILFGMLGPILNISRQIDAAKNTKSKKRKERK